MRGEGQTWGESWKKIGNHEVKIGADVVLMGLRRQTQQKIES